jgi:hypothetical protein
MAMMGNVLERGKAKSHCREERVREIYIYGRFKSEEDEDEQLHLFFLIRQKKAVKKWTRLVKNETDKM